MALTYAIHNLGAMDPMGPLAIVTRLFDGERDARSWLQTQLGSRAGR